MQALRVSVSKYPPAKPGALGCEPLKAFVEAPKAYSVALEVKLTPGEVPDYVSDAGRRTRHKDIGQDFVYKLVDGWNKSLNPEERELGGLHDQGSHSLQ
jgi:hypothetical protein